MCAVVGFNSLILLTCNKLLICIYIIINKYIHIHPTNQLIYIYIYIHISYIYICMFFCAKSSLTKLFHPWGLIMTKVLNSSAKSHRESLKMSFIRNLFSLLGLRVCNEAVLLLHFKRQILFLRNIYREHRSITKKRSSLF